MSYWDSQSALAELQFEQRRIWPGHLRQMGSPASYLRGRWQDRNWLNVPGPFYGAETDTCGCGPPAAPRNVLCDEIGQEFVWRQPRSDNELREVLDAACQDPFNGFGADGDDHWTPRLVTEWWEQRERVSEWLASEPVAQLRASDETVAQALAGFAAYLEGELGDDLSRYAKWLSQR